MITYPFLKNHNNKKIEQLENTINLIDKMTTQKQGVKKRKPIMVMSYDDGREDDYTKTFPAHEDKNAPAVFGIPTHHLEHPDATLIERDDWDDPITVEQLNEIAESDVGHEIASHGATHRLLGCRILSSPANEGDTTIDVDDQGKYFAPIPDLEEKVEIMIIEGDTKEKANVIDCDNNTLTLDSGLKNNYNDWDAYIRLSDEELLWEMKHSKEYLEDLGYKVPGILYPGARHTHISRIIASHLYSWGRGVDHLDEPAVNTPDPFFTYAQGVAQFDKIETSELETLMDNTVENNGCLHLFAHSASSDLTENLIKDTIDMARNKGIEIVTGEEMLEIMGNSFETGDVFNNENHNFENKRDYFVVSLDGIYSSDTIQQ